MKVVILCGGKGTRLREETEFKPKPMIEIGGRPILWHIMRLYAHHGLREFVLCLGYRGEVIKHYFLNYEWLNSSFTIDLATRQLELLGDRRDDWRITLADTGLETMTGGRLRRIAPYIDGDTFCLTYGDGVSDVDVQALLQFHQAHGRIGTVTAVAPPSRYGELGIEGDRVLSFREKPQVEQAFISGGYFVFNRAIFDYLPEDDACVFEREPLEKLTQDGELRVYHHRGFWQCMDTLRDYTYLQELWGQGRAPWRIWDDQ